MADPYNISMGATKIPPPKRPEVVDHHDYRIFLKEWFAYLEQSDREFSLRGLARKAKLGVSTLSMILNRQRSLSNNTFARLKDHLQLTPIELTHLQLLRDIEEAPTPELRAELVSRMQRRPEYQRRHPKEFETYRYLSHWYYVVIREMSGLPGFEPTVAWIQPRLREPLTAPEIEEALSFLTKHGFIDQSQSGAPPKNLDCLGGVYKLGLGKFHKEMLAKAAESIDTVPSEDRLILGHTFAIPEHSQTQAKAILLEALQRLEALGQASTGADQVVHVELTLVPFTKKAGSAK